MANQYLSSRFVENIQRLALGIEAVDALRNGRIAFPIRITFDEVPLGLPRPQIRRHDSAAFALLYEAIESLSVDDQVVVRLFDSSDDIWSEYGDRRRYVPRRLRIPILTSDVVDTRPVSQRARRPALFPGAAYDVSECLTGMRGRVEHDDEPVRWARVQAVHPDTGQTVGLAHCDDRGEFLLLIDSSAGGLAELSNPLSLDITVHTPVTPTVDDAIKQLDALWDLPVELVPAPGATDTVCPGSPPWSNWTEASTTTIDFTLGSLLRGMAPLTV